LEDDTKSQCEKGTRKLTRLDVLTTGKSLTHFAWWCIDRRLA
jgi:hypothetical protein